MKKKITTISVLFLICFISMNVFAQKELRNKENRNTYETLIKSTTTSGNKSTNEILFYEDFSENGMNLWTPMGNAQENWLLVDYQLTGGEVPEVRLDWEQEFDYGTARFVSPIINTSGYEELLMSWLNHFDLKLGQESNFWVYVETTSDGGNTFNEAWSFFQDGDDDITTLELIGLSTPDIGSENLQISFRFDGASYMLWGWDIDNILIQSTDVVDASPTSISGFDGYIHEGDDILISSMVRNLGADPASFDVKLEIEMDGNIVFESIKQVEDLPMSEETLIDFDIWTSILGDNIKATVTTLLSGDGFPENDTISGLFNVYPFDTYCTPVANCTYGDGITSFAIAGIENIDSGCSDNGYGDFRDMIGTVEQGETYTVSMTSGFFNQLVSIWIDFNEDYVFSEEERILTDFTIEEENTNYDTIVHIPEDVISGTKGMRVSCSYSSPSSPDPCANLGYGEIEDYSLSVGENTTSVNESINSMDISIFPNPANNHFIIESDKNIERVQLINVSGQLLYDQMITTNHTIINTSDMESGIYLLKIYSNEKVVTKKLLIEKM